MKKFTLFLLILYLIIPVSVFAYSDYVIASGQNIGIELKSDNPIIVGSYNIDNYNILTDSDLKIGDKILKINDTEVFTAADVNQVIKNLFNDKVAQKNRNEEEIAGYRDVLELIHETYENIDVTPNTILQLHKNLYKYSASSNAGKCKSSDNLLMKKMNMEK